MATTWCRRSSISTAGGSSGGWCTPRARARGFFEVTGDVSQYTKADELLEGGAHRAQISHRTTQEAPGDESGTVRSVRPGRGAEGGRRADAGAGTGPGPGPGESSRDQ